MDSCADIRYVYRRFPFVGRRLNEGTFMKSETMSAHPCRETLNPKHRPTNASLYYLPSFPLILPNHSLYYWVKLKLRVFFLLFNIELFRSFSYGLLNNFLENASKKNSYKIWSVKFSEILKYLLQINRLF